MAQTHLTLRSLVRGLFISLMSGLIFLSGSCARKASVSAGSSATQENAVAEAETTASKIEVCPRQFSGWTLVETFQTETYNLALCHQENNHALVGHEIGQHEAFIDAPVTEVSEQSILATDADGFTYEITDGQLTVFREGLVISQEVLL
jgi:hypothetical protein